MMNMILLAFTIGELTAISAYALLFMLVGAGLALWASYTGRTGKTPVPQITRSSKSEEANEAPPARPTRGM